MAGFTSVTGIRCEVTAMLFECGALLAKLLQPRPGGAACGNIMQDPVVGVIHKSGGMKLKLRCGGFEVTCQPFPGDFRLRPFCTDELWTLLQTLQSFCGGYRCGIRIGPATNAVIVTVRKKRCPQLTCSIVVQSQCIAGDGTSRETGQDDTLGVTGVIPEH